MLTAVIAAAFCLPACAEEIKIQVKSSIRHMASPGSSSNSPPSEATKKALGFDGLGQTRTDAYVLMLLTDNTFSEDPPNGDRSSGGFRMWSEVVADVTCQGNTLTGATFKPLATAFGKEGPLDSVGGVARALQSNVANGVATFSYRVSGRPNDASIPAFTYVRPRSCTYIWHDVSGTLSCAAGQPKARITLKASQFPSHKVWVSNNVAVDTPQGPFENLWKCDSADPTQVR